MASEEPHSLDVLGPLSRREEKAAVRRETGHQLIEALQLISGPRQWIWRPMETRANSDLCSCVT